MLNKRGGKGRPPHRRPAQLIERVLATAGGDQRHGKLGFDRGIIAAARCPLQRRNRLTRTVLQQQRATENLRGDSIAPVRLQYPRGKTLGFVRTLHLQRKNRALQGTVDWVRPIRNGGAFRHRSRREEQRWVS